MTRTLSLQQRASKRIPGICQLLSKSPDRFSSGIWPCYYSKAKGALVWDMDDTCYLDMSIGGIGACILGYADDEVDDAVVSALRQGVASSLNCPEELFLADLLCEIHPWAQQVRYARSGGEALAMAVRIARTSTKRDVVAVCGYHGWQDWYLAANLAEESALDGHLMPGLPPAGVPHSLHGTAYTFRYNHLEELQTLVQKHGKKLAAIVMEPVRSAMPEAGFIEGVRQIADSTGAALIMDEVSAAFRYCTGGAHLVLHSVTPDMAVFSKALGNGYAISAVIGKATIMEAARQTFISSTNWTERVGVTAALACVQAYRRRKPYEKFARLGQKIKQGWKEAGERHSLDIHVGGMDAMASFTIAAPDFPACKAYFVQEMLEQGILASNLCYLMDAHTDEHVEKYLAASDRAFAALAQALDAHDLHKRLRGKPSVSGFARLA